MTASAAVRSDSGAYAGRHEDLASALRSAAVPEGASGEDAADLRRSRAEAADAVAALAKVPKSDEARLDEARGRAESALADIADNGACASERRPATMAGGPASTIACPTQAIKVEPGGWTLTKEAYEANEWEGTATLTNPTNEAVKIDNSVVVVNLTGGRIPSVLTGSLVGLPPVAGGSRSLTPLIGPKQTLRVSAYAHTGHGVTAVTTADIYIQGRFTSAPFSTCRPMFDGARLFEQAPRAARGAPGPGELPACGPSNGTVNCK